jgi:hypothetical protein
MPERVFRAAFSRETLERARQLERLLASFNLLSLAREINTGAAVREHSRVTRLLPQCASFTIRTMGALAVLIILSLVLGTQPSSAVLLPVINSANHIETADSSMSMIPSDRAFNCNAAKCFVAKDDDKPQLFVSYGPRTDTEFLLNYSFLPSVPCSEGNDEAVRDQHRRRLADAFQARSS